MALFEIPYNSDEDDSWKIPIPGDGCQQFRSRDEALAFALKLTKERQSMEDGSNYLCVEGGDGIWRLFTADLLPVRS